MCESENGGTSSQSSDGPSDTSENIISTQFIQILAVLISGPKNN